MCLITTWDKFWSKYIKNNLLCIVFLTLFPVFHLVMKHCIIILLDILLSKATLNSWKIMGKAGRIFPKKGDSSIKQIITFNYYFTIIQNILHMYRKKIKGWLMRRILHKCLCWVLVIWSSNKKRSYHYNTKTKPPLPWTWWFGRTWLGSRFRLWPRSGRRTGTLRTRPWTAAWVRGAASWPWWRWWWWTTAAASFFLAGRGTWPRPGVAEKGDH